MKGKFNDEERLVQRQKIETLMRKTRGVKLLEDFERWQEFGTGIANDFGEEGREMFLKASEAWGLHKGAVADRQYDFCMEDNGLWAEASTNLIFELAEEAGVTADAEQEKSGRIESMSDWIWGALPELVREPVNHMEIGQKREMMLLGALTAYSSALPMFYGVYKNENLSANLFYYVMGEASSGKGPLVNVKNLVSLVDILEKEKNKREMADYQREMIYYNAHCKKESGLEMPKEPTQRMLIMPSDTTATSLYQHLAENNLGLLMVETESDAMLQAFKSDKGNYSNGLRKCFHNEEISYSRRTNNEFVRCNHPRLSVALSGTPGQVLTMFPSLDNGLFSRFMFYTLESSDEWEDTVSGWNKGSRQDVFAKTGRKFYDLHERLIREHVMYNFHFSESQAKKFNAVFSEWKPKLSHIYSQDIHGCVNRAGVMFFRIAMVLTALRAEENGAFLLPVEEVTVQEPMIRFEGGPMVRTMLDGEVKEMHRVIECGDLDFDITMEIMDKVLLHIVKVFQIMPKNGLEYRARLEERFEQWYNSLGGEFSYAEALEMAKLSNVNKTRAIRILNGKIGEGKLEKVERGRYVKLG